MLDVVGQKLALADNQDPDGDNIVEQTSKRKGNMLYVIEADATKVCMWIIQYGVVTMLAFSLYRKSGGSGSIPIDKVKY